MDATYLLEKYMDLLKEYVKKVDPSRQMWSKLAEEIRSQEKREERKGEAVESCTKLEERIKVGKSKVDK